MHFGFEHTLVVTALVASIWLVLQGGERLVPLVAAFAAAMSALIVFGVVSLSIARVRVGVVLPAIVLVAAGIAWTRVSGKSAVTAAAVAAMASAIQVLVALNILEA
jgi:hypothetical protein